MRTKKRKMYEPHPTPIEAHLEMPHVYGGYHVDPVKGDDKGDGSPEHPLKTGDAAKARYMERGVRVLRVPVKYDYAAIHPEFLKMLAEIGSYADNKYGSWAQYLGARLTGNADPINHIYEHARSFQMWERYDHFEGDPRRHLAAIAYNAMMKFAEVTKFGPALSPYAKGLDLRPWPPPQPTMEDLVSKIANHKAPATYTIPVHPEVRKRLAPKRKKKR